MKVPILTLLVMIIAGVGAVAPELACAQEQTSLAVIAYYFHGSFRCPTCRKLEQYSREVIENNFKDELASGKLSFKIVNVEEAGNAHFFDDYQLYTKSLVLSLTEDGKEIRYKNLDKIWEYVGNKGRYENYVRDEVAAFLKEA
ncbi:MAG: nitrophenyl compound nitroreductase subunit ArsF family protein [Candidatus Omnitrophica bacterium]|nr:nitrophenyl compound nitroreductase subunit ArsF family protein [Candidatus Omnitrophota bacterium]MDD5671615.1 nitrophenyl compound nitroreductase subunit ArsF family protein [Candidatus Omnitrophota bacterium]